jgi:hypothetical protein
MPFAGFADTELKVVALRTNGIRPTEIALQLGVSLQHGKQSAEVGICKVGFTDLPLLTRWAMQHDLMRCSRRRHP